MKDEAINKIKELIQVTLSPEGGVELDTNNTTIWLRVYEPKKVHSKNESEVVGALNHLAKRIIEKVLGETETLDLLVDVNDFQKKKVENLKNIAHMMAERARYFKSNIEVDPMTAFERRIIHEFLAEAGDLKTESTGVGPNRRVVIKYVG